MNPRVAMDVTPLQNDHRHRGIGTYVRGLAALLNAQSDVPIEFWGWDDNPPFEVRAPHVAAWTRRPYLTERRGLDWFLSRRWIRARATSSSVELVHVGDPDALVTLPGKRVATTVHDLIPLMQGFPPRRAIAAIGYRGYISALRRADLVFAVSKFTASMITERLGRPRDQVFLAPGGVTVKTGVAPAARERPYFLYVGGPDPSKNLGNLVRGMGMLEGAPEELLVVGQWAPRFQAAFDASSREAGAEGRVKRLGFVTRDELDSLMAGATAVVIPSRYEGFGLPAAEAMAVGGVVVHSATPALSEVTAGAALTFDPESPADIAKTLGRVALDRELREEYRRLGAQRVHDLTWERTATTTIAQYQRILG